MSDVMTSRAMRLFLLLVACAAGAAVALGIAQAADNGGENAQPAPATAPAENVLTVPGPPPQDVLDEAKLPSGVPPVITVPESEAVVDPDAPPPPGSPPTQPGYGKKP